VEQCLDGGCAGGGVEVIEAAARAGVYQPRPFSMPLFTGVRGKQQPVEKVDVGPAGSPKEPRNKAKTLRIHRFQPSNQGLKRARRSFSTR
jgi:hypothetical protein